VLGRTLRQNEQELRIAGDMTSHLLLEQKALLHRPVPFVEQMDERSYTNPPCQRMPKSWLGDKIVRSDFDGSKFVHSVNDLVWIRETVKSGKSSIVFC
jgi:hypothetical protein